MLPHQFKKPFDGMGRVADREDAWRFSAHTSRLSRRFPRFDPRGMDDLYLPAAVPAAVCDNIDVLIAATC